MNKLIYCFIFFTGLLGFSQTQDQILQINRSYNASEIQQLKQRYTKQLAINKREVETFAKQNNLPISYKDSLGNLVAMVEIYRGKPIYLTTHTLQAAHSTRTDWLFENQVLNLDLQADSLTIYVWDGGHARISHQDFENEDETSKISIG